MTTGQLSSISDVRRFLLSGHAVFTLVSKKTGARKTFQVRTPDFKNEEGRPFFFVDLVTGPDNGSDWTYLACIWPDRAGSISLKPNKKGFGAVAVDALNWLVKLVNLENEEAEELLFERSEIWHEGKCCKCGRALTDPASISSGIGPTCAERG